MSEATAILPRRNKEIKLNEKQIQRFWRGVDKRGEDECWEWSRCKNAGGYGIIEVNKKVLRANRVSWVIENGEIPNGLIVCHKCDNPSCCNPSHLFLGTHFDNAMDRTAKGRGPSNFGNKNPRAKLNEHSVMLIKLLYRKEKDFNATALSKMFCCKASSIYDIVLGRNWKHIQP